MLISKPINPFVFVLSLFLGYWLVSIFFVLGAVLLLFMESHNYEGIIIWGVSVFFEIGILTAFALFVSVILKSPIISILASLAFYTTSRMIGFFLYFTERTYSIKYSTVDYLTHKFIYFVSAILPRLDNFSKSSWVISNDFSLAELAIIQAVIFVPFILFMTVFDLKRKEF